MADQKKMLRGKSPLTVYRGAGGPGGHLYRNALLDPRVIDEADRDRLLGEGHIEWVVLDGESWVLAEDTDTGKAGDSVTVADPSMADPNADNGTTNTQAATVAEPDSDDARRTDARAKLAEMGGTPDGRASDAVWVEYAVSRGMDRGEAEKAGKAELRKALANQK